jgi:hypothetical protein
MLRHMLHALLRTHSQHLLWHHFMHIWRNLLQRHLLRKRRIVCQWTVPILEVQPVEAGDLMGQSR